MKTLQERIDELKKKQDRTVNIVTYDVGSTTDEAYHNGWGVGYRYALNHIEDLVTQVLKDVELEEKSLDEQAREVMADMGNVHGTNYYNQAVEDLNKKIQEVLGE